MTDTTGSATASPESDTSTQGGFGSLGSIVLLLSFTWAAALASLPLNDNSFFTHLATGRLILAEGAVPTADPYSFTAAGEPWVVQSWLVSVAYASAERLLGGTGIRLLLLAIMLAATAVLWAVTTPARSLLVRLAIVAVCLFVATELWVERPYMVGVIGLGVVWLALDGRLRALWLVPLGWVWVNSHGSFPLGLLLVLTVVAGGILDRRSCKSRPAVTPAEKSTVLHLTAGILTGAVGPLGPKLLLFPLDAAKNSAVFGEIVEWRAPTLRRPSELAFLVLALFCLLAAGRTRSWRLALPSLVFVAGALYAQRNIVMATMVLAAVCSQSAPTFGTLRTGDRPALGPPAAAIGLVCALAVAVAAVIGPTPVGLGGYPARPLAWIGEMSTLRMAAQMQTGNLRTVLDGRSASVFIDDRVDMYPRSVFDDYLTLDRAETDWAHVLDAHDIEVVVWHRGEALASLLSAHLGWRVVFSDTSWVVVERRLESGVDET